MKREMDDVDAGAAELSPELLAMIDNLRDMDSSSNGLAAAAIHQAETGVRLLAHELKEKKYLFLWWGLRRTATRGIDPPELFR